MLALVRWLTHCIRAFAREHLATMPAIFVIHHSASPAAGILPAISARRSLATALIKMVLDKKRGTGLCFTGKAGPRAECHPVLVEGSGCGSRATVLERSREKPVEGSSGILDKEGPNRSEGTRSRVLGVVVLPSLIIN